MLGETIFWESYESNLEKYFDGLTCPEYFNFRRIISNKGPVREQKTAIKLWEKAEAYNREVSKKIVQKPKNRKIVEHYDSIDEYSRNFNESNQARDERRKNQKFIVWYKKLTLKSKY